MIVSAIDGRMRYVNPGLKTKRNADAVKKKLQGIEGITSASINPVTGSLLVYYDNSTASAQTIRKVIKSQSTSLRPIKNDKFLYGKHSRRSVKLTMLGSITGSMAILLAGSERWHYRIGTVFLSALSLHLYQNYRRIFK